MSGCHCGALTGSDSCGSTQKISALAFQAHDSIEGGPLHSDFTTGLDKAKVYESLYPMFVWATSHIPDVYRGTPYHASSDPERHNRLQVAQMTHSVELFTSQTSILLKVFTLNIRTTNVAFEFILPGELLMLVIGL